MDPLMAMIDYMITEAKKDRDDAHARNFSLDDKRSLATAVTKLEEAKMWRQNANDYFNKR